MKTARRLCAGSGSPVSNEADIPRILTGAYLGGKKAVMFMENSGLRQACEPIARFAVNNSMPLVIMMEYRGDRDESMQPLLDALRIPYGIVRRLEEGKPIVKRGVRHAESS